ncbi:hypothetical protein TNCV_3745561 [Trichonephila clavipes]|nr:hypothetical protein TNCV_3745561 [Trichonephila clavipes]
MDGGLLEALKQTDTIPLSAETTRIHDERSTSVATSVLCKIDFRWPRNKTSKEIRVGEWRGSQTGPSRQIHSPVYVAWRCLHTAIENPTLVGFYPTHGTTLVYYCNDIHQPIGDCEPMFCGYLLSTCCLLSPL